MLLAIFLVYPRCSRSSDRCRARCRTERSFQRLGRVSARWAIDTACVIGVTGAVALLGLLGFPRLRVEGNALEYLHTTIRFEWRSNVSNGRRRKLGRRARARSWIRARRRGLHLAKASRASLPFCCCATRVARSESWAWATRWTPRSATRHLGPRWGGAARAQALQRCETIRVAAKPCNGSFSSAGNSTRLTLFVRAVGLKSSRRWLDRAEALAASSSRRASHHHRRVPSSVGHAARIDEDPGRNARPGAGGRRRRVRASPAQLALHASGGRHESRASSWW